MNIPSVLREAEHRALAKISLDGSIVDIGGDTKSDYRSLIQGNHTYTTVNLDEKTKPDIFHDLEKVLPMQDNTYDHAVLINVLEHIYNYRQLLKESVRIVKPGGSVIIVVPFLFPVHPSPQDFHRFTAMTLERECKEVTLKEIHVEALGSGVFTARYLMFDRLMPAPIRLISYYTCRWCAYAGDYLFARVAKMFGKKYNTEDYALGYLVHAKK